ncbi:MAG TPA: DUF1801 domain-containing protein [Bacteroidia bacterium]|nr:DUF1801 domain-containing protein [Bacteroidia bacterium]
MAENKTQKTKASVEGFLNTIKDEQKRKDAFTILELMKKATKSEPKMWGTAIVGLGDHSYKLASGKENEWFQIGFASRSKDFSLYLMGEKSDKYQALVGKLGKHSFSGGCLHIGKLADVDTKVLQQLFNLQVKACEVK